MTRCDRTRAWLYEADPAELRGLTDSENAAHVRECAECAEMAGRVLEQTQLLGTVLAAPGPGPDVDAILARARLSAEAGDARPSRMTPRRWRRWLTVAAAASIVGVLMLRQQEGTLPGVEYTPRVLANPTIETTAGQDLAVIQTDNPDITVLWFF